jgi:hypothetical protein
MGFSTLIDIIGSVVIGGFLLLTLLRMNETATSNNYNYSGERIVQKNLVEVVQLIEYDFRKIGYSNNSDESKFPDQAKSIIQADSTSITFLTDIVASQGTYGDGIIDTVRYYLGPLIASTPNPNDKILYRVVNHEQASGSNLGVTQFKITYFDDYDTKLGTFSNPMPSQPPFRIKTLEIDVAVENPAAYGKDYSFEKKAIWRQIRLAARNFRLR